MKHKDNNNLRFKKRKETKKKKKADAQKERVRTSQLKVDKQTLENPIGKYTTGITDFDGGIIYWVTDTQTSDTYALTWHAETSTGSA